VIVSLAGTARGQVETARVTTSTALRKVKLPGEFLPYESVAISARVNGYVDRVDVDRGSAVRKGQLLARLSAPEMAAQLAEAEAKVQAIEAQRAEAEAKMVSAQSTYERLKAASATPGAVAGNELVIAEKAVTAARAVVGSLEKSRAAAEAGATAVRDLANYLNVKAPFDGIITERLVHPGALVGPTTPPLFRLEKNSRLRLVVAVPETNVGGIVRNAKVAFTVPAYPGETFYGTVARIPRSMDPKTRTMAVELDVVNTSGKLAAGMYPEVAWPVQTGKPALVVPASAVVTTTERTFVVRVNGGRAEWVNVRKLGTTGELAEVIGDLRAEDEVVRRGTDEIRDGSPVRVKR
jgi:RND family efflux transporter MFP subunit